MKKIASIFLLAFMMCSFGLLMPSIAQASSGGSHVLSVQHVQVAVHPNPLSTTQLATLRANMSKRASRVTSSVAPTACIPHPSDANCSGQDPINAGCIPDQYTVAETSFDMSVNSKVMRMGLADLRFSNACVSNWTKGFSGNTYNLGANGNWTFTLDELDIVRSDKLHEPYFPEAEYGNAAYTNMVYAPVLTTQACVSFFYTVTYPNGINSGGNTGLLCTAFF